MCSASTIYTSLKESGLKPGNWACFPGGGGGVGIQGVQLAEAMGFRPIVVDTGDERRALAKEMGAEAFVDFKDVQNPAEKVVEITGGMQHSCSLPTLSGEFQETMLEACLKPILHPPRLKSYGILTATQVALMACSSQVRMLMQLSLTYSILITAAIQSYPIAVDYLGYRAGAVVMWYVAQLQRIRKHTDTLQHWNSA